jgi:hypothetical protein
VPGQLLVPLHTLERHSAEAQLCASSAARLLLCRAVPRRTASYCIVPHHHTRCTAAQYLAFKTLLQPRMDREEDRQVCEEWCV